MNYDLQVVVFNLQAVLAVLAGKEDGRVQRHLKLWAGADERTAHWFGVRLPAELQTEEVRFAVGTVVFCYSL